MFDGVAANYDLTNDVISLGQARLWRKAVARAVDARPAQKVLDLAAGTATSSQPFVKAGAYVVPCDFSLGMLKVGKERHPWMPFTAGDGMKLPFRDETFDTVTISFGLRNIQDTEVALRELYRVTKPGGKVVICEFSQPTWTPFRTVYTEYLMRAIPPTARAVSSNPDAYVYLAESIRDWPDQPALAALLQKAGWSKVAWRNLTGGVVALHRATPVSYTQQTATCPRGVSYDSARRIPSRSATAIDRAFRSWTIATTSPTPAARTRSSVVRAAAEAYPRPHAVRPRRQPISIAPTGP